MLLQPLAAVLVALASVASAHPAIIERAPADATAHQLSVRELHKRAVTVTSTCSKPGLVAATFDDGPYQYEQAIVNDLKGAKGTFFFNGNNYDCIYNHVDTVRSLYEQGHILGSHTWSHPHMASLSASQQEQEISKIEDAFVKILGVKPRYFRAPFGEYNQDTLDILSRRGYTHIFDWSDDTGDANGESVSYSKGIWDNAAKQPAASNSHIVLSHSTIQTTSTQVMPYALGVMQNACYKFVDVEECTGGSWNDAYTYVGPYGTPDSSWHC